ncbi:ureidoglycolate lyase [Roseovarius spongiae]|uniref:Ureidoglycolate lyase n=1 Tax=Roseovarius spongiae TaxID=2320272 RepID=A0A3A8B551_9RHOB|nr:ureidoglycolate lyase [Roseovarius spongiae]RKF14119.1 ureidoglycolate lyase [Roseovarius spongiae]
MRTIAAQHLTPARFAPFGDVIALRTAPDWLINEGRCGRHHDLARLDFSEGRAGISLFDAAPVTLPMTLAMMERHPDGSQAFLPMNGAACLVTVAPDEGGRPGAPRAFVTAPGQGVNLLRGVWHGVFAPLGPGPFAVIDRIGEGANLEEHWFKTPWAVTAPQ